MLDKIINHYVESKNTQENINVFVEINKRFIKEVQERYAVVIVEFMQNFVFEQQGKIVLTVNVHKAKELGMKTDILDLTANTTRSIALEPTTGVFSFDISINGKGGVYKFNSKDLETIDVVVLNDDDEVEHIPLELVLTTIHEKIMAPKENVQVVPEDLPANVVRGNFGK
ncbi:hypothetical protein AGENTSMITH_58 [Bacillus phage vB_BspM_AgentSmith]|nr:hypothetical protein AGENTSMITH_58 [Bacillus phage vB_BspM_AgentSmith]